MKCNVFVVIGIVIGSIALLLACCSAQAREAIFKDGHLPGWSDTRARVLLHWPTRSYGFGELRGHFVLPNVLDQNKYNRSRNCISYVGLANRLMANNMEVEPALGWRFKTGEPIASLRVKNLWQGGVWSWSCLEYTPATKAGYYFWQCDGPITLQGLPVQVGLEAEGWLQEQGGWTHGGGPNLIFTFHRGASKFELHTAVHYRRLAGEWAPELFFRFNLFPGG